VCLERTRIEAWSPDAVPERVHLARGDGTVPMLLISDSRDTRVRPCDVHLEATLIQVASGAEPDDKLPIQGIGMLVGPFHAGIRPAIGILFRAPDNLERIRIAIHPELQPGYHEGWQYLVEHRFGILQNRDTSRPRPAQRVENVSRQLLISPSRTLRRVECAGIDRSRQY